MGVRAGHLPGTDPGFAINVRAAHLRLFSVRSGTASKDGVAEGNGQLDLGAKLPLSFLMLEGAEKRA